MTDMDSIEILLVEDNPNDAELALRALRKNNLANKVFTVHDGQQALDFLFCQGIYEGRKNGSPKVIFLDLKLPKVDGLEVLRAIRSDEHTRHIPVVVLTSSQEEQDIVATYELGVNSFIVKPIDFNNFMKAIVELGFYWLVLNKQPQE